MKTKTKLLSLTFAMLFAIVTASIAAPPDLTAGGVPNEDPAITINLGPTGARGWVYHVKTDTSESRQILVTEVDSGSPAVGILAVDDVIIGADGTGANPSAFSADARKSLALAIADAEARTPATLKILRWRSGSTATVTLTLQTMGAYSATAPYNCPKSALILQQGLQYVYDHEDSGRYSFGAITLLANGNSTYQAKAQTEARALIPSQATMDQMMSDERDATSMITWQRGHTLIFLAEYYLATGDTQVLPAVEAYAVNIAKNTSLFGTVGHIFAEKNPDGSPNGPMGGVYGPVNTPGLFCFLGVLLAKECGLTNPEIDPAIERASRFFAYYSGKGAIPYGEHEPFASQHENNGKCGLTALAFMLQNNRVEEGKFFAKMSTASATEREVGHTGSFFNYLWAPLGAAAGGEEAAAAHFSRISWMLDLNRRWDGGFDYDCLNGEGPNSGSQYNNFRMSTVALLTYALPLREMYITGKGHEPARWLSSADVTEAIAADDYDADSRTDSELIADLGNWSPKVRKEAGVELGTRSIDASELSQITAIANNTGGSSRSRAGACYALGQIGDSSSAATLAALVTDSDPYVRYMAAESMRYLPGSAKLGELNTILTATDTTSQPLYPLIEDDPLHFAHGRLAMLLFYHGSAYGPRGIIYDSVDGVDRNLLYPAIRAVAQTPIGISRSTLETTYDHLTYDDVLELSGTIVDSITDRAPSDKMFSEGVRRGGVSTLYKFGIAEGVPACMIYAADEVGGRRNTPLAWLGTFAGGVHTVEPDPGTVPFLESYLSDPETAPTAQASLDAIAADTNPTPLTPFKSIQSVTADKSTVAMPALSTVLRVTATDYAQGDSTYTWSTVSGPSIAAFFPNGNAAAADTTVVFDGTPGIYQFEVKMSDSRGLTEATETVSVQLTDGGGTGQALKVFILAGQSNMEGHGEIDPISTQGTLEYIFDNDPVTYGLLKESGNWAVRDDVWIWYKRGGTTLLTGGLTAGYGAYDHTIGPELQFGHVMGNAFGEKVLIIKTAWGGKSLAVDFRPPSSGWAVNPPAVAGDQGFYYQEMMNYVNDVLTNLSTYFPAYNPADGYELAGFGWHQGWNDRVNQTYADEYEYNMQNFINDVRTDLTTPNLPFVIATTGMAGWSETHPRAIQLMQAQLAMEDFTKYPAFEGNVAVVDTRDFWRDASVSPADQSYHWNRNAETYYLIGQSMALEMQTLISSGDDVYPPTPDPMTFAVAPSSGRGISYEPISGDADSGISSDNTYTHAIDFGTQPSGGGVATINGVVFADGNGGNFPAIGGSSQTVGTGSSSIPTDHAGSTAADAVLTDGGMRDLVHDMTYNDGTAVIQLTGLTPGQPYKFRLYHRSWGGTRPQDIGFDTDGVGTDISDAEDTAVFFQDDATQPDPGFDTVTQVYALTYDYTLAPGVTTLTVYINQTGTGTYHLYGLTNQEAASGDSLIYEPFDMTIGDINGQPAGKGLSGNWTRYEGTLDIVGSGLSYGTLPTSGNHVSIGSSVGRTGAWASPGTTLSDAGLLDHGATLWFSFLIKASTIQSTNDRTLFTLGTDTTNAGSVEMNNGGNGIGVHIERSKRVQATTWSAGIRTSADPLTDFIAPDEVLLVVGQIIWGADGSADDTVNIYLPGTDLVLPGLPWSTATAILDQSAFDTICISGKEQHPIIDEIRFGAAYDEVLGATADMSSAITMTAAAATDLSGVEYYFDETSGNPGGTDSGWQDSPTYVDTGLTPGMQYTYTVTARDKSVNQNATAASTPKSATIPAQGDLDIFSVNFYAYGAMDAADYDAVTLETGESAGLGSWNTTGWENYAVPWGLSSPASPVTITSTLASTATLTLNDVRNGGPYLWNAPHTNLPGDANGDLMDGHGNGTDDPYDGSLIFDMTVSDITYNVYDVIIYIGSNAAQFGDGTGKIVLNGGAEQGFTLPSGEFNAFAEIVDDVTPGNYIVYRDVTGSSFTVQAWGNGFNHIGPTGFQIIATAGEPVGDTVPDVLGLTQANAEAAILAAGFTIGTVTTDYSDTVTAGDVISQSPAAGTTAVDGSPVDIQVSLGVQMVTVPNVVGQDQATAQADIVAAQLAVGTVTTAYSDTVALGDVISQNPTGGASVVHDSTVDIVVSLGVQMVTVPSVVGQAQSTAQANIVAAQLIVGTVTTAYSDTVALGDVISQNPTGGASVVHDSTVDIVVSLGVQMVTVPNVVGQAQSTAQANILAAQLIVGTVTTAYSDTVAAGDVISQNPTGGTSVVHDSAVNLVVSLGVQMVTVPDVVGQAQSTAQANIVAAQLVVGNVTTAYSSVVPIGDVISQNPNGGVSVVHDSAVDIVVSLGQAPDTSPPTPNPATFAVAPAAAGSTAITMTATTGSDASGPVEYLFTETSGNPGGSSSGWQTSTSYTDTGLDPDTQYTYTVTMRDSLGNTGTASSGASAATDSAPNGQTIVVTVPNSDFETIYKPGSTTVTATITGWTQGVGPDCPIDSGTYTFSDQTTASTADIPGWVGYDRDGWIALGGTYARDETTGNLQGSVSTGNNHTPGGANCYLSNGGSWGNPAGGLIVSDASLGTIQANAAYTLSMYANGAATPIVLKLLANGVEITPSSSVDPTLSSTHQEFSRTYDIADLTGYVGHAITIVCGVDRNAAGTQSRIDDVSLTYFVETDPPTPDPAAFASAPAATSSTAITMTATTGADSTGPVEYLFTETSGNPGGTSSSWQTSASYTDTGLTADTQYTYTVTMRDSLGNTGTASAGASAATDKSIFEMEDGVLSGAVIATAHAGYTGTGFVDYTTGTGSVGLTVNVSTGGSYNLSFRYALGAGDRPLEIKVNGQVVNASLSFPATGAWNIWGYTATVPVTLNAGNNTVTATGIGSSGANVDHLLVQ